jgi:hypothetical protein
VTSTAGGIMPVTVVDGGPVGTGVPGPLTRKLRDLYWASHHDPRYSTQVRYLKGKAAAVRSAAQVAHEPVAGRAARGLEARRVGVEVAARHDDELLGLVRRVEGRDGELGRGQVVALGDQ